MEKEDKTEDEFEKNETQKEVKGKSSKVWKIIVIVLCMLLTLGIGFFLGKELTRNDNKKEPTEEKKEEPTEEKKEEPTEEKKEKYIELSENEIKSQINVIYKKLYTNLSMGMFNGLDNKNKLALVLDSLEFENKQESGNDIISNISIEKVEKAYYDTYGEKLVDYISAESNNSCSSYSYDKTTKRYNKKESGCDIGWGWFITDYIYNYEFADNKAYIYTSIAVEDGIEQINIITDNDCKDQVNYNYYDECIYKKIEGNSTFELNASNYKSFAKYKLTFERQDNQYYLKKIEKIENGEKKK